MNIINKKHKNARRILCVVLTFLIGTSTFSFSAFATGAVDADDVEKVEEQITEEEVKEPAEKPAKKQGEAKSKNSPIMPTIIDNGDCGAEGGNVQWSFDTGNGVLNITGSGEMKEYSSTHFPWFDYRYDIKKVIVGSGVTSISAYSFHHYEAIESVQLSEGLRTIGKGAFYSCTKLADINFPTTLQSIGDVAFIADKLVEVDLSSCTYLESIGEKAFNFNIFLESVKLPDSIKVIKEDTFGGCYYLEDIKLPSSVENIEKLAFSACVRLNQIDFTKLTNLKIIGPGAFNLCNKFETVDFTKSLKLTTISESAFEECLGLKEVIFPKSISLIEDRAFAKCDILETLIFNSIAAPSLGDQVFEDTPARGTINYPANGIGYTKGIFGTPYLDNWFPAPLLTGGTADRISENEATVSFTSNEDAEYFYKVLPAGEHASAIDTSGTGIDSVKDVINTISLTDIEKGKAYEICIVAKDSWGNVSETIHIAIPIYEYSKKTLTHEETGISVTGWFGKNAQLKVSSDGITHDKLLKMQDENQLMALYDISATGHRGDDVTVSIPVGSKYDGKTLNVLHGHEDGTFDSQKITVKNGAVKENFHSLSPYAVQKPTDSDNNGGNGNNKDNNGYHKNGYEKNGYDKNSQNMNAAGKIKTGDESNMMLWASLMLIILALGTGVLVFRKRHN